MVLSRMKIKEGTLQVVAVWLQPVEEVQQAVEVVQQAIAVLQQVVVEVVEEEGVVEVVDEVVHEVAAKPDQLHSWDN